MFERDRMGAGMDRALMEAAWRFHLLAPLLDPQVPRGEKRRYREKLASKPVEHPWRGSVKLSGRTLRRWCRRVRESGLTGLMKRRRVDLGVVRALPEGALAKALELREQDPRRTVPQLIRLMVAERPEWGGELARSTLDRHLRARGSRRQRRHVPEGPFVTFEADAPQELWQGDILHGPVVLFPEGPRKCRVIAWLDDHSRYLVHLEAYPDERLPSVEDSLLKAILKFGLVRRIFVDNAWVYSLKTFSLACAELGILKVHSTPRWAPSRGKVERMFGRLRSELLNEVEQLEEVTAEQLNRWLAAWVTRYHGTVNSRTGQTPRERFSGREFRPVTGERLEQAFWQWATRSVSSTGEVKFAGNLYHVDLSLAGRRQVVVRFDPFDLSRIWLWEDGAVLATATPEQLVRRTYPRSPSTRQRRESEAARHYLEDLAETHFERLARELNLTQYQEVSESDVVEQDTEEEER